jgi:hypothetical protein
MGKHIKTVNKSQLSNEKNRGCGECQGDNECADGSYPRRIHHIITTFPCCAYSLPVGRRKRRKGSPIKLIKCCQAYKRSKEDGFSERMKKNDCITSAVKG